MTSHLETSAKSGRQRWAPAARLGILLPLTLTACGGATPSDLFGDLPRPTSTTSGSPPSAVDSGTGDTGAPPSSPSPSPPQPVAPPANDAGIAPGAPDSAAPADVPDAGPNAATCPLSGKAAAMIDDGSSSGPNAGILAQCGRAGSWYTFDDGASKQSPASTGPFGRFLKDTPPGGAAGYVRTWGTLSVAATGTQTKPHWGAGLGFDLADAPGAKPHPYDVKSQGYQGFSFWVRTQPGNQIPAISFQVLTSQTAPYADGAYHGVSFPAPAAGSWTKVSVPFVRLMQPSWTPTTEHVAFDAAAVMTLQWSFDSGAHQALGFDVAIGAVELW